MTTTESPFLELTNLSGKHKDWYGTEFIKIFCSEVNPHGKLFDSNKFVDKYKSEHSKLELKARIELISKLFDENVEHTYEKKLVILKALFRAPLSSEDGMFTKGFYLYPASQFVEKYGNRNIDSSLDFIEQLTMRFTGEWAIRSLANDNEKKVLKRMKDWAKHNNFHVRRLSSEGLRARLPWGSKIDWIDANPEKSLVIYNKLRNDPILYVRRSVANSMGDMLKINEGLALETLHKWFCKPHTAENLWVIKHAIRTPVKNKQKEFTVLNKQIDKSLKKLE